MAPLIQDTDCFSLSSHDDVFDQKTAIAPLHEGPISSFGARRRVSFGNMDIEYDVMSRHEYTSEELEASWFTMDDMSRMKKNARTDAKLFECGLLVEGAPEVSIRGLEGRTTKGIRRKRQSRMDAYAAVFSELDFQDEVQHFDDELIADAYFMYSEPCAILSQIIGMRAASEVTNMSNPTQTMCRTSMLVDR